MANYLHLSTVTSVKAGGASSHLRLRSVTVNKGVATAVITVYDGQSTSGTVVAVIDGASKSTHWYGDIDMPGGIFVDQTVAAADVTVSYV